MSGILQELAMLRVSQGDRGDPSAIRWALAGDREEEIFAALEVAEVVEATGPGLDDETVLSLVSTAQWAGSGAARERAAAVASRAIARRLFADEDEWREVLIRAALNCRGVAQFIFTLAALRAGVLKVGELPGMLSGDGGWLAVEVFAAEQREPDAAARAAGMAVFLLSADKRLALAALEELAKVFRARAEVAVIAEYALTALLREEHEWDLAKREAALLRML